MALPTLGGTVTPATNGTPLGDVADPSQVYGPGADEVFTAYRQQFGRNPTQQELAAAAPSAKSGDPNIGNQQGVNSFVSSLFDQQQNTPQNIYQKQQADLQKKYSGQQSTIDPQVMQIFQSNLGRAPTPAEVQHFGLLIASGQDPYQIQQALQQTTEYQNQQTKQFSDQLTSQLQATNADYFQKYIMPSIQSNNAMQGRTQDSSGYQAQIANAGQQQNYDLQNYLAQVAASGYQGSVANNAANYQSLLGQQYGLQNAGVSNQLANSAANTQYNQNLNMYQLQQQAYSNYLNQYGKRNGNQGWGQVAGGVAGSLLGGHYGGTEGAKLGYSAGTGIGGAAGAQL